MAGDYDGDGADDLAVPGASGEVIAVALSNRNDTFRVPMNQRSEATALAYNHNALLASGDVDGDGLGDVLVFEGG